MIGVHEVSFRFLALDMSNAPKKLIRGVENRVFGKAKAPGDYSYLYEYSGIFSVFPLDIA